MQIDAASTFALLQRTATRMQIGNLMYKIEVLNASGSFLVTEIKNLETEVDQAPNNNTFGEHSHRRDDLPCERREAEALGCGPPLKALRLTPRSHCHDRPLHQWLEKGDDGS